jgi:hypothetical protein
VSGDPEDEAGAEVHPGGDRDSAEQVSDRPGVTVSRNVDAPPGAVMAVLLRAETFPVWVVGPGRVVSIDPDWPGVGAGFTHETGRGPLKLRDRTTVQHLDADNGRITLLAAFRPAGRAAIQLHVVLRGAGSRVVMHERPISGPGSWLPQVLYRPALRLRNVLALARLEKLVRDAPTKDAGR